MILAVVRHRLGAALAALGAWCAALLVLDAVLAASGLGSGSAVLGLVRDAAVALGGEQDGAPGTAWALAERGLAALAYLLAGRLAARVLGAHRGVPVGARGGRGDRARPPAGV